MKHCFAAMYSIVTEIAILKAYWKKKEVEKVKQMKLNGFDLQKIAVPLPDYGCLKKYRSDKAVKEFLQPYQTINPYRLKKPFVD